MASISHNLVKLVISGSNMSAAHSIAVKLGLISDIFVASALLDGYCKLRRLTDAHRIFDEMSLKNAVAWNSLIRGYSKAGFPLISLKIFAEMIADIVRPTSFTISVTLLACSSLASEDNGAIVHSVAVKCGFCSNVVVASGLADMYSKCSSSMEDSQKMFDEMRERNVVTWTSLVTGYTSHRFPEKAMELIRDMKRNGFLPNEVTFSGFLGFLIGRESLIFGKQIHTLLIRRGMEANPYTSSALISMYSKCGGSDEFLKFAGYHSGNDQVLENSIVSGFSHMRDLAQALAQLIRMKRRSVDVDSYTFGSLLWATGSDSAIEEGKQLHTLVFRTGFSSSIYVQNGLVAMYARCGEIDGSERAFSEICGPDLVSWNSLISGLARHGLARRSLEMFGKMRSRGVDPDETTFLSVLSACDHCGLVDQGLRCFDLMAKNVARPATKHYASLVDLLGRAGYLELAESLVNAISVDHKSSPSVYRSLVNSCKTHGSMEAAAKAAASLLERCAPESSSYVLASNLFAEMSKWGSSADVRGQMAKKGLKKEPGKSLIDGRISA